VLVYRPGGIGDLLFSFPLLSAITHQFPQHPIVLCANSFGTEIALACNLVHSRCSEANILPMFSIEPAQHRVITEQYSALFYISNQNRARVPVTWIDATPVTGLPYFQQLLTRAPFQTANAQTSFTFANVPQKQEESIVIHPGSGSYRKNWDGFREVTTDLLERSYHLTWVLSYVEQERDPEICSWLTSMSVPHIVDPSPAEALALLANARGYIGNDTGFSHLAALTGCRSIHIYQESDPAVWGWGFDWITPMLSHPDHPLLPAKIVETVESSF
jgi:heptosyltransferase III